MHEGLPYRVREDVNSGDNECLWIEITRSKCKPTIICCAYRAPDADFAKFTTNLENGLLNIDLEKSDFVLLGDLNINMLPNLKNRSSDKQMLLNLIRIMDLNQLISKPTRISNTTRSLIDIILVNNEHRIVNSGVIPVTLSDHFLVFCVLKAGVVKAQPRIIEYRSYKRFDINAFNKDLENVPWHIVDDEQNINDALFTWNKLFIDIVDEHAAIKKRRVKGVLLSWMNDKLSEMIRDRDYHHRKAIKSGSAYHWQLYKKLRNLVNREVKSAKSKYYCNLIEEAQGNTNKLWKAVNEASSRNCKSSTPQCIISDGV